MKKAFVRGKVLKRRCNRKGQELSEGKFDWVKNGKNGLKTKGGGWKVGQCESKN